MANLPKLIKIYCSMLFIVVAFSTTALAANPFTSNSMIVDQDKENQTTLTIYRNHSEDSKAFHVANMFPGDAEMEKYFLAVSYRGTVTIHFHVDIRPGYEKLAEVMNCRVVLKNTNETVYDGLMKDMPESLEYELVSRSDTTDELEYEITAYLSTSVGNDYMNKGLVADFRWWAVEEKAPVSGNEDDDSDDDEPVRPTQKPGHDVITDQTREEIMEEPFLPGELVKPPKTGDSIPSPVVYLAAACFALFMLLLLGRYRKEEKKHE